jgi:hypothetical protein
MDTLGWVILIAEVILGIILCFGGYKFKSKLMAVIWFVVGYLVVKTFLPMFVTGIDPKILFLITILGGLIFAFFSFELTSISEYLIGFFAGFTIATSFLGTELLGIIVGIVAGLILATIAWKFAKYIIILATAYVGAYLIAPVVPQIVPSIEIGTNIITLVLFAIGAIVQFLTTLKRE